MTGSWVSIIALVGWLVLAIGALRAHQIGAKKTIVYGLAWVGIFFGVALVISLIGI